jgi:hypothetical protein
MNGDESKRPWGYGLTVAALTLAIVALLSLQFWRRFERRGRSAAPADASIEAASSGPGAADQPGVAVDQPETAPSISGREPEAGRAPAAPAPPRATDGSPPQDPALAGAEVRGRTLAGREASPPMTGDSRPGALAPIPRSRAEASGQTAGQAGAPAHGQTAVGDHGSPGRGQAAGAAPAPAENIPPEKEPAPKEEDSDGGPASDRTPPVLAQIRFDPGVVEAGSATTLTIQATDNLTGVKSLRGEIQSPSGKAVLPLYLQEAQGGTFTYVLNIPPAAETGVWFVKWLYLTDVADNSALTQVASASTAPPGGTFSVSSSESDSIPPDVVEVTFEKDTLEEEDRNVIRVEVKDDLSGVASVAGACQSPSRSALVPFTCALNEATGLWEGEVVIPENGDCGVWSVQQLTAKDKAGNATHLGADSRLLAHADFKVAPRADCDSTPPTLDAFALSQTSVPIDTASEIRITASVHDVGTGAATLTGWFEGPASEGGQVPKKHFTCAPDPDHPDAPWTGTIEVPQFTPKGIWKVRVIRLEDKALNFREYTTADPVLSGGAFEVR